MKKLIFLLGIVTILLSTVSFVKAASNPYPCGPGYQRCNERDHRAHVQMKNNGYEPGKVTIPRNSEVTWTNRDRVPHTITFPFRDSGKIQSGHSYTMHFRNPGTYNYHCGIHPNMHGQVIVR
jgi:plastocyanin